jgi:spermidine synthase
MLGERSLFIGEQRSLIQTDWALIALYGLSGLTSVAYEVLWTRMLSLQFGISVFAVVLTVATFMLGLGGGCLYSVRRASGYKSPLRIFAALEGSIALYALLLPKLLRVSSGWIEIGAVHLSLYQWYGLIAVSAFCLLLLPAFAMGVGFPLILRVLGNSTERLSRVYGINTLGAASGALLPLWLLPTLGWAGGIRVIAVIGLIVAISVMMLTTRRIAHSNDHDEDVRPNIVALIAYAGIGAASLILEVGWTRLFGMVMLRTEYVLALILAVFLLGIGLGSLIAPRQRNQTWIVALPVVAGGYALVSLWMLPVLSAWLETAEFPSLFAALTAQGVALAMLTLPVTLALGAWLPILNERLGGGGLWLYGVNCLGAAFGAAIAGLLLIPTWGSATAVTVAALVMLIMGSVLSRSRAAWIAVPVFIVAAWPVAKLPQVSALLPQAQAGSKDLYLYEDAISMTHVVEQRDGQRVLLTDLQRMDASTDPTAVFVQSNQARLPLLLHPHPRSALFLGLGTGISLAGSLPFPGLQRTAVELSQGAIISASRWFDPVNRGVMNQAQVVRDDARHFLSSTKNKYDVIIGDVFHPDMAGYGSLLSIQQFERARSRLNENGLFVQWLAINQFDYDSLAVILRSFNKVFPEGQLFLDGMHLALVGPNHQFAGAQGFLDNFQRLSAAQQEAATAGEGEWTWLGRYWGPISGAIDTAGPIQDEWSPVIEFELPRARYSRKLEEVTATLAALLQHRPGMQKAEDLLGVKAADREAFERAYGATELMTRSWIAAANGSMQTSDRLMYLAYQANSKDRWIAYGLADSMLSSLEQASKHGLSEQEALKRILEINPRHVESLRLLWRLERQTNDPQAESTRARLLELSPLDFEARTAGK